MFLYPLLVHYLKLINGYEIVEKLDQGFPVFIKPFLYINITFIFS